MQSRKGPSDTRQYPAFRHFVGGQSGPHAGVVHLALRQLAHAGAAGAVSAGTWQAYPGARGGAQHGFVRAGVEAPFSRENRHRVRCGSRCFLDSGFADSVLTRRFPGARSRTGEASLRCLGSGRSCAGGACIGVHASGHGFCRALRCTRGRGVRCAIRCTHGPSGMRGLAPVTAGGGLTRTARGWFRSY